MSAAVTSASVRLPNGVLVSVGDSPGAIQNMVGELTVLLGEPAARAFMSKVREAFLSDVELYVPPARPSSGGGNKNWGGPRPQQNQQQTYQGRELAAVPANGNVHTCAHLASHGPMVHKAGVSAKGNNYELWECPAGVCDTQWPARN